MSADVPRRLLRQPEEHPRGRALADDDGDGAAVAAALSQATSAAAHLPPPQRSLPFQRHHHHRHSVATALHGDADVVAAGAGPAHWSGAATFDDAASSGWPRPLELEGSPMGDDDATGVLAAAFDGGSTVTAALVATDGNPLLAVGATARRSRARRAAASRVRPPQGRVTDLEAQVEQLQGR